MALYSSFGLVLWFILYLVAVGTHNGNSGVALAQESVVYGDEDLLRDVRGAEEELLYDDFDADSKSSRGGSSDGGKKSKGANRNSTSSSSTASDAAAPLPTEEEIKQEYERERRAREAEARRQQKIRERKQESQRTVKHTISAKDSEHCDWRVQPLAALKGEVCGSHYKVLGVNRRNENLDKSQIKKAYRRLSLSMHPDKNPSSEAKEAFRILQDAYDCLLDDECKSQYDDLLAVEEERIYWNRQQFKDEMIRRVTNTAKHAHYYVSIAANHVYQVGMHLWEIMGGWTITLFGEEYPMGRPVALALLLWKGQFLLMIHLLSYIIMRINYEIAKSQGWL